MMGVGSTASAAIQFGEAVCAFAVGIYVAAFELIAYGSVGDTIVYVTEKELFFSDELMTWIKITGRSNRNVFRTDAAA